MAAFLLLVSPVSRIAEPDTVPLDPLGDALLAVTGLSLGVRRRWPLVTYLAGVGAAIAYLALRYPGWPVYIGAGLALVAYVSASGRAGWPLALTGGAALAIAVGRPEAWQPVRMLTVFAAWLAVAVFTAQVTELRRRRAEEDARHRVVAERLRIAREMHDLLSHSLATISIQSGTGLRLFKTHPEEAESALRAIRHVSQDALAQARAALATIRDPVEAGGPPAPTLDHLDALFASVRAAGLVVEPSVDLAGDPVPAAVGSAAYRVVQESLTNVMRHAGKDARATVDVVREQGVLVVEVTDGGNAGAVVPAPPAIPGHGLIGMRERVLELGGEFTAGPRPGGGFQVRARLPTKSTA